MTTLIIVKKSGGRIVGRCDASCYNATAPDCDCVCGGKNHGVGLEKAAQQVSEYTEEQLKALAEKGGSVTEDCLDVLNPRQGTLL